MRLDDELVLVLREAGLADAGESPDGFMLEGGVSSDVICAVTSKGRVCIKRALPRLKVVQEWTAPIGRAMNEAAYLKVVDGFLPGVVPKVLHVDQVRALFVMPFLAPDAYPNWKMLLTTGATDVEFAQRMGAVLGHIHATSASQAESLAPRFANRDLFHALRIEPYLLTAAKAHPDRADALQIIAENLNKCARTLVHGDVSPKNILVGPEGPVLLDAECATWGDPAFDLAFCLAHLLLKAVWHKEFARFYASVFDEFYAGYITRVTFEARADLEARAVPLLAALLLARIDGKSPVEYLKTEEQKRVVRDAARAYLEAPPATLKHLAGNWHERIMRA
jgi:aminoglycoside phosphotransferase (APT) family kinase protein